MVHKSLVYQKLYDRYSRHFIESFCAARKEGHNRKHSFAIARIRLQDMVISELVKNKKQHPVIIQAYQSTRRDQQLYEKAIASYNTYNEPPNKKE